MSLGDRARLSSRKGLPESSRVAWKTGDEEEVGRVCA
jgi:hypothetical protein